MSPYAHIAGWGMYVPQKVLTNQDLTRIVDTTDEWIRSRTGIKERHIASDKETTASMAIRAARDALDRARIHPTDVDLVIVATITPEHITPSTASLVQNGLGAKHAGAFDLSAGCTGFVYGLSLANAMIRAEQAKIVVVIGSETLSRIVDWEDRTTCVLFGDGAGAVVLKAGNQPGGVLSVTLGSDGSGGDYLIVPAGGSKLPASIQTIANREHFLRMNGPEVFKFATRVMGKAAKEACEQAGVKLEEVAMFIPHQANARIIQSAAKYLNMDPNKVYKNLHKYGNTSSASIPIALCEAIAEGKIKNNDNLVFVGFGAGLTWGATVIRWGLPVPYRQRQPWYRVLRRVYYYWANLVSGVAWQLNKLESKLSRKTLLPLDDQSPTAPPPSEPAADTSPESPITATANGNGDQPIKLPEAKPDAEIIKQ